MPGMVPFPLRISSKMKARLEVLAKEEGEKLGPLARKLLNAGYESRMLQLQNLGIEVPQPEEPATRSEA